MKLNNSRNSKSDLADLRKMLAGPARLTRLLTLLDQDIAQYPLDANPPDAVTEAHTAYLGATSVARQTIEGVETAKEAAGTAAGADLSAAMQAIQAGKILKSTTQPKAADAIAAAVTFTTAAENLVEEAHDALVDAVQKVWLEWRPQIIRDAAAARVKAAKATKEAAAAVTSARGCFATVTTLDHQILARDTKLAEAVRSETRQGLPWYESTRGGAPLGRVILPGVDQRKKPEAFDLAVVVDAVAAAVAEAGTFPASDWVPPSDPAHAELLAAPLDPATPWVMARAMSETGTTCSVCCRAPASAALPVLIEGKWWTVCPNCFKANAAEQDKILAELQRQGTVAQHGVDPHASFSVGEDGSHHPA